MSQTSRGSQGQLEDAKMPKDMTSGLMHTQLYLSLLWVITQKGHGPFLGNQCRRKLVQKTNQTITQGVLMLTTLTVPRALLPQSVFLTFKSSQGWLSQNYLQFSGKDTPVSRKILWNLSHLGCTAGSKMFSLLPPTLAFCYFSGHILRSDCRMWIGGDPLHLLTLSCWSHICCCS